MSEATLAIMIAEAKEKVNPTDDFENRLKSAMKATIHHWLELDETEQFRAAIGTVLLTASDEEKERIAIEMKQMKAVEAMINGVPVDFEAIKKEQESYRPIGLLGLWKKIRLESRE